ncbi:hypothetical protein [Pseudomonas fulva]|uniref:hypothetical protein n=1 Tax=Pseudomonas fulva TaxID=47880 RepID=UPI0034CE7E5B
MIVTTKPIKNSDENICGAEFSASGVSAGVEAGVGNQKLTFNAFSNEGSPSTASGVLTLGMGSAQSIIQIDSNIAVMFSINEITDYAIPKLDPNSEEPRQPIVPHTNVNVTAMILSRGTVTFNKSYKLEETDEEGNWQPTSETGVYVGGGFSISMPTQMGAPYKATFQRTDLHAVQIRINASTSAITATAKVAFPLEDKGSGFTTREIDSIQKTLRTYEKEKDFFYLDSQGHVTTGVGFMLPNEDAAASLSLLDFDDNPATEMQKRQEWRTIHALPTGYVADWYEDYTELYMSSAAINEKLNAEIIAVYPQALGFFEDFGSYPSAARVALQDIIYNVGEGNFRQFVLLQAAVRRRDWATAAAESHRTGIEEARNNKVRDLFLSAAGSGDF